MASAAVIAALWSGQAMCDNGLVIDLSLMKGVPVDPLARTVRAEGSATTGELDHVSQAFGLAVPGPRGPRPLQKCHQTGPSNGHLC
jgi:FAD/FMN-containing dehydrogenase